jgi:hypothetical protein
MSSLRAAASMALALIMAVTVPLAGAQQPAAAPKAATAKSPQKAFDKPLWHELSRPQQVALEPLAGEWDRMEGLRKQKWLEIANRFSSMKPDEQQRVHERMREWVKMTPEQRRVVRENYSRAKKIEPSKKSAQWEQYQQLPEEQKKKLAAEAANKKRLTNLPPKGKPAPACRAGTVKNSAASTPACVPAPEAAPPAAPTTAPPAPPAAPVPNAK